ncbi:MAG: hypothetical protein WAM30_07255, partial [Candidatus Dormiibacterota bacterium]
MPADPILVGPEEEVAEVLDRIRQQSQSDVTLLVPPGAEVASSRFSLQLLAVHTEELGKRVVIVSDDERVVGLAADCGLVARSGAVH